MKGLNNMSSQSELGSLITLANIFSRLPWETAAEISLKVLLPREEKKLNLLSFCIKKKKKTEGLISLIRNHKFNDGTTHLTNKFLEKVFYIKQKRFLFSIYRTKTFYTILKKGRFSTRKQFISLFSRKLTLKKLFNFWFDIWIMNDKNFIPFFPRLNSIQKKKRKG